MDRKDDQPKEKMITHAWKLLGEELIKYRGHRILFAAMSCWLRSLFSSLEHVRATDGFSRTDGFNEYMVELSSALSVLFTTLEQYYQYPKAIISASGIVQYHGHYQYCRTWSSHWRGKWTINLPMSFCSTYDISLRH